jgi:uncharacterized phosphosugar-binding protein
MDLPDRSTQLARDFLFDFSKKVDATRLEIKQLAVAAKAIATDSQSGGRFKWFGCLAVSHDSAEELTVIDGGWVVMDQNVWATWEGRKKETLPNKEDQRRV